MIVDVKDGQIFECHMDFVHVVLNITEIPSSKNHDRANVILDAVFTRGHINDTLHGYMLMSFDKVTHGNENNILLKNEIIILN